MSDTTAKSHYSASELAGLPGLPKRSAHVSRLAGTKAWPFIERTARGGTVKLYPITALPAETHAALVAKIIESAPALPVQTAKQEPSALQQTALTPAAAPLPAQLANWQRDVATARKAIIDEVKRIGAAIGTDRAVQNIIRLAAAGELPEQLQRLVPVANAKSGAEGTRSLSRRSLYRWMKQAELGFVGLAPAAPRAEVKIPAWVPTLLKLYQRPHKPSLAACMDELGPLMPEGVSVPSYHAARRFLDKMSSVDVQRGRMGPRELQSIRPYVRRDTSHMWPGDCYTADGHTFDAEVAHPAHGKPFRPEITCVLDVATRRAVGWSAGLNESTWAVLDAQRNAIQTAGVCALWYVDNGSGYRNAMQADQVVGFAARLGMTITHSLPYNSQARGIIERSHQTIWVRAAKQLPTYMGAAMDREARGNVFKLTRRDIKEIGTSRYLMTWADFLVFCQQQIDAYNNQPHRGLPKTRDPVSGKQRHLTPMEAWKTAQAEGWEPISVSKVDADDLFRPYKICHVSRGQVQLYNNSYFHPALEDFHGEKLHVGYDIHDATRVWVRDPSGRLICVAEFEANRRAYFPQSVIDQAAEKREAGRIKRAEVRIEEARAERSPPALIDQRTGLDLVPLVIDEPAITEKVVAIQTHRRRPMFDSDAEKYRWLMEHAADMAAEDNGWVDWYRGTGEWSDLFGDEEALRVAARV